MQTGKIVCVPEHLAPATAVELCSLPASWKQLRSEWQLYGYTTGEFLWSIHDYRERSKSKGVRFKFFSLVSISSQFVLFLYQYFCSTFFTDICRRLDAGNVSARACTRSLFAHMQTETLLCTCKCVCLHDCVQRAHSLFIPLSCDLFICSSCV